MRKKVFKTLVAVLALAAVTGPVRGQTVPDVEYNLRGIPQGWTATANGNNVTVTDGKTAPIDPASPVSLTPPAADIHRVQNVTLSSITINLDEVDMTNPPVVIVCGDGDTITGSVTGDIFIILPDLQQVNPAGPKVTFKNANIVNTSTTHAAVFVQGNGTIAIEGTNTIASNADGQPGIAMGDGDGHTITFIGAGDLDVNCGSGAVGLNLNGATCVNNATGHITIAGFAPVYSVPTVRTNLNYNGGRQALLTAGTVTQGGTMYYSTDGENWTATVPTALDAGNYNTYYKIEPSGLYQGVEPTLVGTVTINKVYWTGTVTVTDAISPNQSIKYRATYQGQGTISSWHYRWDSSYGWSLSETAPVNNPSLLALGKQWLATIAADKNHYQTQISGSFK